MRYLMQMVGSDQQSCGADTVQFTVGSTWMFMHQNVQDELGLEMSRQQTGLQCQRDYESKGADGLVMGVHNK
jgi:hypothetical protein